MILSKTDGKERNYCYYQRRGRKSVGSHTPWGKHNPNALSIHIKGEADMTSEDRKNTRLPCGRTVRQSWAALRKCWLAFNITKSQGNGNGMTKYAYRIRTLQHQMGIKLTDFDASILDEELVRQIDAPFKTPQTSIIEEEPENAELLESPDESANYEEMMTGWFDETNIKSIPDPREEIFAPHNLRTDKSSPNASGQTEIQDEMDKSRRLLDKVGKISKEILASQSPLCSSIDNSPEDEVEYCDKIPVSPAIAPPEEMYATYHDRTERSCPVPDEVAVLQVNDVSSTLVPRRANHSDPKVQPEFPVDVASRPTTYPNRTCDYVSSEERDSVEREHKRIFGSCYFKTNKKTGSDRASEY